MALVTGVEMQCRQAIVAGEEELGIADLLGQGQGFLVHGEGLPVLPVALVDLPEDDQGHRQVIDEAEPPVEIDGRPCRFHPPASHRSVSEQ